jgi:hypothetical protein
MRTLVFWLRGITKMQVANSRIIISIRRVMHCNPYHILLKQGRAKVSGGKAPFEPPPIFLIIFVVVIVAIIIIIIIICGGRITTIKTSVLFSKQGEDPTF